MGIMAFNKNATERAKEDVKKAMDTLNKVLLTKTYLVGERITLADVCVAYAMKMLFENVLDAGFRYNHEDFLVLKNLDTTRMEFRALQLNLVKQNVNQPDLLTWK